MKSRSTSFRKNQNRKPRKGPLFLGHKVLSELRILMRLAAGHSQNGLSKVNGACSPSPSSY